MPNIMLMLQSLFKGYSSVNRSSLWLYFLTTIPDPPFAPLPFLVD